MTDSPAPRSSFAWDHFRRWFVRGRLFRIAIQARLLTLATIGLLLTAFGWWGLAQVFSGTDEPNLRALVKGYDSCPWREATDSTTGMMPGWDVERLQLTDGPKIGRPVGNPYLDVWRRLSAPWRQLFELSRSLTGATFLLLAAVWAAAVWGLLGGAITRAVVVQLAREEAISLGAATRYAASRWISYFSAPLFPLVGVAVVCIPAVVIGGLMHASLLVGGLLWPVVLLVGLTATIMLAALSVGWPLMHGAISAEGSDSFDALSRSYSYVYQRPLHYLLYAASAVVLGLLGLAVVDLFANSIAALAAWSASWGSGRELMQQALDVGAKHDTLDAWGAWLIWFWQRSIRVVVLGFAFSYFWTVSTAIYLLLRNDADGVVPDEVFLDDDETFEPPTANDTTASGTATAAGAPPEASATAAEPPVA